ncbi:hypothetical protein RRG54_04345 [Mycoplasmopsis felis]|uniref:hypothetical protein n=1 Tax=Mycoplasmopsis felis TaxID=33923 RepID=UPI00300C6BD7
MKPFLPLENITFDTLEQPIHEHPVIIFYDEYTERYWYLKARSKYDRNGNVKVKYRGEIEVSRNKWKKGWYSLSKRFVYCTIKVDKKANITMLAFLSTFKIPDFY